MEVTKKLIKEKFYCFNEKYFDNKICECKFRIENTKDRLGRFIDQNVIPPILCISKTDFYNNEVGWDEDRLDVVILHEMIHALIYSRHGETLSIGCHGIEFRLINAKIFLKHGVWIGIGGVFSVIEKRWSKLNPLEKVERVLLIPINWLLMFVL